MSDSSGKTQVLRNPDGTFPPGVSGNPAGPGKGYRHMSTKLRKAIEKISTDTGEPEDVLILKKLMEKAKEGDMQAIKIIFNYLDGMPIQGIELGGIDGEPIDHNLNIRFV